MLNIRRGVFETNSSSMHSLTMSFKIKPVTKEEIARTMEYASSNGKIVGGFGEYGWGYDRLSSFEEKLSYVLTWIKEHTKSKEEWHPAPDEVKVNPHFVRLAAFLKKVTGCDLEIEEDDIDGSYIDHESIELLKDLFNAKDDEYEELMTKLLFDYEIMIIIDNDNH